MNDVTSGFDWLTGLPSTELKDETTFNQISQNAPVIELNPAQDSFAPGPDGLPEEDTFIGLTLDGNGLDLVSDSNVETDGLNFNFLADLSEIIPGFPVSGFGGSAIAEAAANPLSGIGNTFFDWAAIFDGGSPTIVI